MVTGSWDATLKIWDNNTREVSATLHGNKDWINGVAITLDGKYVASGSTDSSVKLFEVESGEMKWSAMHAAWVTCVAFDPSARLLASGSGDTTINIWNVENGSKQKELKGHSKTVQSVKFSPDG